MSSIRSLQSITLDLPPCCIELHPSDSRYAVIGTYKLEKQKDDKEDQGAVGLQKTSQSRNGSLILIEIIDDEIKFLRTQPTPSAILDIHFTKRDDTIILGAATSTGSICLYRVDISDNEPEVAHLNTLQFFPEDVLITAFQWHPNGHTIGMTLTDGQVSLGDTSTTESDPFHHEILLHDLEAWILAFIPDGSGILSGGDDCALRFFELPRDPIEYYSRSDDDPSYAPWRKYPWADTKVHGAGVTAILPLDWDESGMLVLTGSYDDNIRLTYIPTIGRRQILAEENLGGGVWRIKVLECKRTPREGEKWHPNASDGRPEEMTLLVSCMYAGARIVKLVKSGEEWAFEVLAKFEEHKSMNYASDAQSETDEVGRRAIISTSFYDRLVCLWKY